MKNQPEYNLQKSVCAYLRAQYPQVLFMSDTVASLKLTMGQAQRNKAIQCPDFATPDVIIFQPKGIYCGLFIELKTKSVYKADGVTLLKNEHVENQAKTIQRLNELGYKADFAWSFEMAKGKIDEYLKGN